MTRFQYISDIHLEHCQQYELEPVADYLILAGDIGYPTEPHYETFIEDVSRKFQKVFIVMGNHEYWEHPITHVKAKLTELSEHYINIHFLDTLGHVNFATLRNKAFLLHISSSVYAFSSSLAISQGI